MMLSISRGGTAPTSASSAPITRRALRPRECVGGAEARTIGNASPNVARLTQRAAAAIPTVATGAAIVVIALPIAGLTLKSRPFLLEPESSTVSPAQTVENTFRNLQRAR
jgi:hypothetical protein